MRKIKVGDKVFILSGKDKGKVGIVLSIFNDLKKSKILAKVEGLNLIKKHSKPVPNKNKTGGILSVENYIDLSNLSLFCSSSNKNSKVFFSFLENGKKCRFFKINKEVIN